MIIKIYKYLLIKIKKTVVLKIKKTKKGKKNIIIFMK